MTDLMDSYTAPEMAKLFAVTIKRVEYAIRMLGIEPERLVGRARVYSRQDADSICARILETNPAPNKLPK